MPKNFLTQIGSIQLKSVSFSYFKKEVLDTISMDIKSGNFTVIVGPNGAGKSTLLKCSNQLIKNYTGTISMNGIDFSKLPNHKISSYIGYVPQNYQTLFSMTVFESLLLGLEKKSSLFHSKEELNKVSKLMDQLGLSDIANEKIDHLSGGQQQKVTIARALVKEPPFLFMDEPTSGLDIKTQREVMFFLKNLTRTQNIGVLAIIHDINLAAELADKIVLLKNGKMIAKGKPKDVVVPNIMEETFEIKNKVILHEDNPHILIINEN